MLITRSMAVSTIGGSEIQSLFENNTNIVSIRAVQEYADSDYEIEVGLRSLAIDAQILPSDVARYIPADVAVVQRGSGSASSKLRINIRKREVEDIVAQSNIHPRGPCPPGFSIGHPQMSAGTFGLLAMENTGDGDRRYILSNNHVIAASNYASKGDDVIQPGSYDGGGHELNCIATVHSWVPLDPYGVNLVDVAIALVERTKGHTRPRQAGEWSKLVRSEIKDVGAITHSGKARIGMKVEKSGRTTGITYGKIVDTDCDIRVNYGPGIGYLRFRKQILTTLMSARGDSGSVLVDSKERCAVGLLFSGTSYSSYFNHINAVWSEIERESGLVLVPSS